MNGQIQVVVTDRDPHVCAHLRAVVDDDPQMRVVATAATSAQLGAVVAEHRPDVVVIDPHILGDGDLFGTVRSEHSDTRYLIHSTTVNSWPSRHRVDQATAVVLKRLDSAQLLAAIHELARGIHSPSAQADPVEEP